MVALLRVCKNLPTYETIMSQRVRCFDNLITYIIYFDHDQVLITSSWHPLPLTKPPFLSREFYLYPHLFLCLCCSLSVCLSVYVYMCADAYMCVLCNLLSLPMVSCMSIGKGLFIGTETTYQWLHS